MPRIPTRSPTALHLGGTPLSWGVERDRLLAEGRLTFRSPDEAPALRVGGSIIPGQAGRLIPTPQARVLASVRPYLCRHGRARGPPHDKAMRK